MFYKLQHSSYQHNTGMLMWFLLICLTFPLWSLQEYTAGNYYQQIDSYKMEATSSEINMYFSTGITAIACASRCSTEPTCKSFTISTESHTCVLFSKAVYDMSVSWLSSSAWDTWMLPVPERVNHSDWTLVFRGTAGIESSIYDTFLDTSHDGKYEPGCLRLDNGLPCQSHFRSTILNNWTNIDQVRVSVYKDGIEQQYIVFDGVNSTITSWFTKSRIIESSWTNLQSTSFQHFSVYGFIGSKGNRRRFYMNVHHFDCSTTKGYLVILDSPVKVDGCGWEFNSPQQQAAYPWILYSSSTNTETTWYRGEYGMAAVFAVSVKFTP